MTPRIRTRVHFTIRPEWAATFLSGSNGVPRETALVTLKHDHVIVEHHEDGWFMTLLDEDPVGPYTDAVKAYEARYRCR